MKGHVQRSQRLQLGLSLKKNQTTLFFCFSLHIKSSFGTTKNRIFFHCVWDYFFNVDMFQ